MSKATVELKDPAIAALLAWLVPGLGHLYQGRIFKAVLYSTCILSTFFCGMYLGDGKVVNWKWDAERRTYGYLAQVLVGIPALPALIQSARARPTSQSWDRRGNTLEHRLNGQFKGFVNVQASNGREFRLPIAGRVDITPSERRDSRSVTGELTGEIQESGDKEPADIAAGAKVNLTLTSLVSIEPPIFPSPNREFECDAQGTIHAAQDIDVRGAVYGKVLDVRTLVDSFEAPLDETGLQDANGDLGKYFELGLVYTWIAGLLNILAMWDAFEGPAYGIGDEESRPQTGSTGVAGHVTAATPASDVPPPQPSAEKRGFRLSAGTRAEQSPPGARAAAPAPSASVPTPAES